MTIRRFAFHNIWFWTIQAPMVAFWDVKFPASFQRWGVLYLALISIFALSLSSLSWWQSARVEEDALTVDTLVEETTIEEASTTD